jgi:hypothetical protein
LSVIESIATPLEDGRSTTSPISLPSRNFCAPWNETFWNRGWSMFRAMNPRFSFCFFFLGLGLGFSPSSGVKE